MQAKVLLLLEKLKANRYVEEIRHRLDMELFDQHHANALGRRIMG
jgi:hypothetical protein